MDELVNGDYAALLGDIKTRIHSAQYAVLKAVNKELIDLYRGIGELIVERQQESVKGKRRRGASGSGHTRRVPRHSRLFGPKSLADEAVL